MKYFKAKEAEFAGYPIIAARMSYVGEAGWELTCKAEHAGFVYEAMVNAGARAAGLFAQTSAHRKRGFQHGP